MKCVISTNEHLLSVPDPGADPELVDEADVDLLVCTVTGDEFRSMVVDSDR